MTSGSRLSATRLGQVAAVTIGLLVTSTWLPRPAHAGDAFLRGGVIFEPRDIGFAGRWRASFGSDYPVTLSETVFVGFELQTSVFRQDVPGTDGSATLVPGNGYINLKFKSGNPELRPYAGGGIGLLSTFVFIGGGNEWVRDAGFHVLGGVELGGLSVELELSRTFEESADTTWAVYAGFVW